MNEKIAFPAEQLCNLAISILQITSLEERILNALACKELYGMQIIEAFDDVSGGEVTISLGTLYPVLARLEKQSFIVSREVKGSTLSKGGSRRKVHTITQQGLKALSDAQKLRNDLYQWKPAYGSEVYT
jgi:DNA-binding PadR family transcriptional regulator